MTTELPRGRVSSTTPAASVSSFTPGRIRDADFPEARRGYNKDAVRAYLHGVAEEVAALRHELAIARNETVRHKNALREWQSQQAGLRNDWQPELPPVPPPQLPPGPPLNPEQRTPLATTSRYQPAHGQHRG